MWYQQLQRTVNSSLVSDPLSYSVKNSRLVLDSGMAMEEPSVRTLNDETIRGEYISGARGLRAAQLLYIEQKKGTE